MGDTYLVTGGSGFVGLAVIKMLAKERPENVSHVKVLDIYIPEELKNVVESEAKEGPTFEWIVCDITDQSQIMKATKGCDVVLHIASITPGARQDFGENMRKVNVIGAKNVVDACCKCGVRGLVYMSTVGILGPNRKRDPIRDVHEDTPYDCHPRSLYGETKKIAEDYVLAANGHIDVSGTRLVTCSLRPSFIYGQSFALLKSAYKTIYRKTLPSMISTDVEQSSIYVGNLAIATISVAKLLQEKAFIVGGEFYFIKDDTPPHHAYRILARSFAPLGITLSRKRVLPFVFVYAIYWMIFLINCLVRFLGSSTSPLPSPDFMWRANATITLCHRKLIQHFGFKPEYTPEEAFGKIGEYVLRLKESEFEKPLYDFDY